MDAGDGEELVEGSGKYALGQADFGVADGQKLDLVRGLGLSVDFVTYLDKERT